MVKVLHLALFATLLISFATCDESGTSGGSDSSDSSDSGSKPLGKSKENKKHETGDMIQCDEPNPTNTCTCDFTDGLRNLNSLYCNANQQSIFLQWEQQMESSILVNINWSVAQRIILVYYSYQQFAQNNPDIDSILKYKSIKSYGLNLFLVKDLQSVAYSFADETIASTILLDSNNDCNLFDALRSAANSCGASTTASTTTVTTSSGSTTSGGISTSMTFGGSSTSSGNTIPTCSCSCSSVTSSGSTASSGGSTTSGGSTSSAGSTTSGGSTASGKSTTSGGSSTTSGGSTTSGVSTTTTPRPSTTTSAPLNCSSLSSNVNVLISQITVILQNVNLTTSSQLAQIYVLLNNFFIANPGSQNLFASVQITGFYSIQSFFDLSFKYQQSTTISTILIGDFSTSPLLLALESAYKLAFQNPNVPNVIFEELQAFYDTINAIFISTSDTNQRLKQFSLEYYQFVQDLLGIEEYLDDLLLIVGGSIWGSLSDLIFISSDIVFPQVDITQIDSLISPSSNWNQTILVQAFYFTYTNWNQTYNFHNYGWGISQWAIFRTAYLNNNISLIISSTTLTNKQKHQQIFAVLEIFISAYVQQQFFYCIPLGSFGTLADYKRAVQTSPPWNCEVPRECFYERNILISIQSDNSTLFTNGWNNFTSNLPPSDQALVQPFTNNIFNIIYGPPPPGGPDQQIFQLVTQLQNCKAAVPARAPDVDNILVGKWGHLKKFQDCQSTATITQYPS